MMTIVKFCGAARASKSGLIIHYETNVSKSDGSRAAGRRNAHGVETRAPFCSKMSTPCRRERSGKSAAGVLSSGGAPKTLVFIGERENAHRAQARVHVSKCAPRAGESSILPTQDDADDLESKQNEHRAVARAPFPIKMCTARRREAQKCPSKAAEVLPLWRRAPYMSQLGPA